MNSKYLIGFLGLSFLLFFPSDPTWAYPGSVFGGIEEGELFTGSRFALNANYDLMLSLYEKSGLGAGFYYHDNLTKFNLSDEPRLKQYDLKIPEFSMAYFDDRILEQKEGNFSFLQGNLIADGTYYNNTSDIQSRLSVGYKLPNLVTDLTFRQNQDESEMVKNDFEWKQQFKVAGNIIETDYQNNQYKYGTDRIVGESSELLWTPAWDFLRIGTGHFEETSSGITQDRTRVRAQYYHTLTSFDNWKFGGSLEEFLYSGGDQRQELTAAGQYRQTWQNGGYYQFTYEDIQRTGDTPFEFDDDPEHTCDGAAEFNWHIGNNNTDLLLKYDFTESQWDQVKGYTEFPICNNYSVLWVAQYNFDDLYNTDQTTYLLELKHSGTFSLFNRLEWNYHFDILEISSKASIPVAQDRLDMEVSYSFYYNSFDVLKLNYTIYQMGQLTLKCEFERDRFMLIYTWL
jgi:hypothetical protein